MVTFSGESFSCFLVLLFSCSSVFPFMILHENDDVYSMFALLNGFFSLVFVLLAVSIGVSIGVVVFAF